MFKFNDSQVVNTHVILECRAKNEKSTIFCNDLDSSTASAGFADYI